MYHHLGVVFITAVLGWFLVAVFHCHVANAYIYNVGDEKGWTYDVFHWSEGKSFSAGDELHFYYTGGEHNVVIVNQKIYENCFDPNDKTNYPTYDSGNDIITLKKGYNYFASSKLRDCTAGGIKLAVFAK